MENSFRVEPISVAFVVKAQSEVRAIEAFAAGQTRLDVSAVVVGGGTMLSFLKAGLHPKALFVDSGLSDITVFSFLREARSLKHLADTAILVGCKGQLTKNMENTLLTCGMNCDILMPYTLAELFGKMYELSAEPGEWQISRVQVAFDEVMCAMHAGGRLYGREYLERIVLHVVLSERHYSMSELYQMAAEECDVTFSAVKSAVLRLSRVLREIGSALYRSMCLNCNKAEDAVLSNSELIRGVAEQVRKRR